MKTLLLSMVVIAVLTLGMIAQANLARIILGLGGVLSLVSLAVILTGIKRSRDDQNLAGLGRFQKRKIDLAMAGLAFGAAIVIVVGLFNFHIGIVTRSQLRPPAGETK